MKKFGKEFKKNIETVNDNKKINYGKDYKKIDLSLMKTCH